MYDDFSTAEISKPSTLPDATSKLQSDSQSQRPNSPDAKADGQPKNEVNPIDKNGMMSFDVGNGIYNFKTTGDKNPQSKGQTKMPM